MKATLGPNIKIDVKQLIASRLLVQANSGGGKSWMLRKLLEETHGQVQQIVLDIEGDFATLREKFDYVLAGKGGDVEADPGSADVLANKILELKSDLIVDLYELPQSERILFVKNFLEAMINAPKKFWHPVLVVLDEAQIFAPEKAKSESLSAVIDIATRGRKRGFCIVLATQRLSKLHKDAAAECNNKMIGRTGLDIDLKRAMDELGLNDGDLLRKLKPGHFYCYGPAISSEVILGEAGNVKTTHPRPGVMMKSHKPAPSGKVKSVLKDLSELIAEEEQEKYTLRELEKVNRDQKMHIKKLEELQAAYKLQAHSTYGVFGDSKSKKALEDVRREFEKKMNEKFIKLKNDLNSILAEFSVEPKKFRKMTVELRNPGPLLEGSAKILSPKKIASKEAGEFSKCERAILGFLQSYPHRDFNKVQVAAMSGYRQGSGGFNNSLARLNTLGLIRRKDGRLQISLEGEKVDVGPQTARSLEDWINKLSKCELAIYTTVLENPETAFEKVHLAEVTGYADGSGGFNNSLARLNTLGLIKRDSGKIKLNEELTSL